MDPSSHLDSLGRTKKACTRCRSLKARCPGPGPDTERCSRCIKAGEPACVYEDHKRGRKVGTRLSDPTKALMRMKSALSVLKESGELAGLEDIQEELLAKAASASKESAKEAKRKSAATARAKARAAKKGKGRAPSAGRTEDGLEEEGDDDDDEDEEEDDELEDGFVRPTVSLNGASGRRPLTSLLDAVEPVDGFTNDDLYSHRPAPSPSSASYVGFFPPGASDGCGPSSAGPSSHLLAQPRAPSHPGSSTSVSPAAFDPSSTSLRTSSNPQPSPYHPSLNHHHPFPIPQHAPAGQFDDLVPLRSSSKSLATLFRPRSALPNAGEAPSTAAKGSSNWRLDVVSNGVLEEAEARLLFDFFMRKVAFMVYLFDPLLHTHDYVRAASSFLYATILAIALRFAGAVHAKTHARVLAAVHEGVFNILAENVRSVEAIQGLLLMTEFKGIHDEGSYLTLGIAVRIGMDMNIGQPVPGLDERQMRNRVRAWYGLFNADRRFGGCGQIQKPEIMPEDAVIRASSTFHTSPLRTAGDARLTAGVQIRRLLSRYTDLIQTDDDDGAGELADRGGGGQAVQVNMHKVYDGASAELDACCGFWEGEIQRVGGSDIEQLEVNKLHCKLIIAHHWIYRACRYPRSSWLHTTEEWEAERRAALATCLGLSVGILNQMVKMPLDVLRYSPDSTHLFYSYGTTLLEKLFRARLLETHVLDPASTQLIFDVLHRATAALDRATISQESATALHANLLRSLLPEQQGKPGGAPLTSPPPPPVLEDAPFDPAPTVAPPPPVHPNPWPAASDPGLPLAATTVSNDDVFAFASGWAGLDDGGVLEEALAALGSTESSLGVFDWDEMSFFPP